MTGCWLCTGAAITGYGVFGFEGKNWPAHRWAYITFVGDLGNLQVCHACDVRNCVNPEHLWLGTQADNIGDAKSKGRLATGDRHGSRTKPERIARGARHGSRTKPEKQATGDRHGSRTKPERLARGVRHGSRTKPERLARGGRHGSRTKPERLARGDRHGSRTHPARIPRGENRHNAKLTWADVRSIRARYAAGGVFQYELAEEYGVNQALISGVVLRKIWIE